MSSTDTPDTTPRILRLPKTFTYVWDDGTATEYFLSWTSCVSPICPCTQIHARVRPDVPNVETPPFDVDVDVYSEEVSCDEAFEPLADAMIAGWDEDTWKALSYAFHRGKRESLARTDLSKLGADLEFPVESIQEEGELIPWSEHVPFDEKHFVELGEHAFLVDDQYCVKKGCGCSEIILSFIAARRIDEVEGFDESFEGPVSAAAFNLKSGKWRPYDEDPAAPVADLMKQALAIKGFRGLLRRRMKTLRSMYLNHLKAVGYRPEEEPAPALVPPATAPAPAEALVPRLVKPAAKKAGRNEPCPCGSGKKYKHCCLR